MLCESPCLYRSGINTDHYSECIKEINIKTFESKELEKPFISANNFWDTNYFSWNNENFKIYNLNSGTEIIEFKSDSSFYFVKAFLLTNQNKCFIIKSDNSFIIYDLLNKQKNDFKGLNATDFDLSLCSFYTSKDGQGIRILDDQLNLYQYSLTTHKLRLICSLKSEAEIVKEVKLSPDGKRLASVSKGAVKIWDFQNANLIREFKFNKSKEPKTAIFNNTGEYVYSLVKNINPEVIYDGIDMLKINSDEHDSISLSRITMGMSDFTINDYYLESSHSGKFLFCAGDFFPLLYDMKGKYERFDRGLKNEYQPIGSFAFSPNENYYAFSVGRKARINPLNTLDKGSVRIKGHDRVINAIDFSPDSKFIATAPDHEAVKLKRSRYKGGWPGDCVVKIWNVKNGKLKHKLKGHSKGIITIRYSPSGEYIATAGKDHKLIIWKPDLVNSLFEIFNHTGPVLDVKWSKDNSKVISVTSNKVYVWDILSGSLISSVRSKGGFNSVNFSADNQFIVLVDRDTRIRVYDIQGNLKYTKIHLGKGDWIAYDTHYRYDGSPHGIKQPYFVCGLEVIELEQVKDQLYIPGLVERLMKGDELNGITKIEDLNICGITPLIEPINTGDKDYHFSISPRYGGLGKVEVYINNKLHYSVPKSELHFESGQYYLNIKKSDIDQYLLKGENNPIRIIGYTEKNENGIQIKSRGLDTEIILEGSKMSPSLYAVMIGVSDYKDNALDLNYSSIDAEALSKTMTLATEKLFDKDHVFFYNLISNHLNKEPNKQNIKRVINEIGSKAKPEDVILIFFAGHGAMVGEDKTEFTLLTSESTKSDLVGINFSELMEILSPTGENKLLAQKRILIFDACNSGSINSELLSLARDDKETKRLLQLEELMYKSGLFVLSAAAKNQSAYELKQISQGLLTYALLSAIRETPEGNLNVMNWFIKTEEKVRDLTRKYGLFQEAQPLGSGNFDVGNVDDEVKNSIVLSDEKPMLLCVSAEEINSEIDKLDLKLLLNETLERISARGYKQPFVYVDAENSNAIKVKLKYELKGEVIICRVLLLKDKMKLNEISIEGLRDDREALISKIIVSIKENLN